ncbi:asparagine synthetase domain-containing protein 1 [Lepeophtheirus salmonis]|uniref:Asparagine synthetase domaincontaining protein 1like [Ciona intestinalis] n=1 Tax=Lepeophtheirus salmonis TaxID=72036 RepID=A0A0K2UQD1_LEPSM|nr:asparagine synthetase domain-containing protein 1-like [Lepeophtheirus salmonis]
MCGILLIVESYRDVHDEYGSILERIRRRGPDFFKIHSLDNGIILVVGVLWLQGSQITPQPHSNDVGGYLLWNGDAYGGLEEMRNGDSDTQTISRTLEKLEPQEFFDQIRGPFAFSYTQGEFIWFGRDYFGRHSLLFFQNEEGLLALSSVGDDSHPWLQVPTKGIYRYSIIYKRLTLFPWNDASVSSEASPFGNLPLEISDSKLSSPIIKLSLTNELSSLPWIANAIEEKWRDDVVILQYIHKHSDLIKTFEQVVRDSVLTRVEHKPPFCGHCLPSLTPCSHSKIGILFSGGLDSSYLAYILHSVLSPEESIVLFNVAFGDAVENVPDRITGRKALKELEKVCPQRNFIFEAINISKEELVATRQIEKLDELLLPSGTVLDDSIGCALWFAAGKRNGEHMPRVLLIGSGIDEQLGGYSRHRAVFNRDGWNALFHEIRMEIDRISERNLGRDNRIISDHGVASRIPFLDERVVNFLNSVPLPQKMDLSLRRGLGEKLLLRAAAYDAGLISISSEPKRAIQFGSRIAKIENKKEKGSDIAVR